MPTETTIMTPEVPLTAQDRCDGCSARATTRVWMPSGLALLFCTHHYKRNAKALADQGAATEESTDA